MLKIRSRYDSLRTFKKISDNIIEFESLDTLYYTGTGNNPLDLDAIDLDGGPFICKGYKIKLDNNETYTVIKIKDIYFDENKDYFKVYLKVIKS